MAKVSLIVPVYNPKEDYFKECIDSLLNQTLDNIEIIIIDNGATGRNSEIAKEYEQNNSNVKLIFLEKNMGFSYACNQALKIATGEYIQIVDSDDFIEKNTCELLYKKATKNNADLIVFASNMYNQKTRSFENNPHYSLANFPIEMLQTTYSSEECIDFIFRSPLQDWNKFVKRELVFENNNFFTEDLGYVLPDCVYSIKNFINAKKIMCEKECLYHYRVNISSSVVKGYAKEDCKYLDAPIIFSQKIDEILEETKNAELYAKELVNISLRHIFGYYDMVNKKNRSYLYKKMQEYFVGVNPKFYTKANIKNADCWSEFKRFKKYSFSLYNFLRFLYTKSKRHNTTRIKFFGLSLYKKKCANFKIYRRYLGFIHTEHEDFNARMDYIIQQTTENICKYLDTKIRW